MPKRVLAIGVGGTGKAALTILKERLEETYGQVPDNVVLLSFDTDDLRTEDSFGGARLSPQVDDRKRESEFRHIVSKPGVTMDTIFADIAKKKTSSFMYWLEQEKLDRVLGPTERDIRGGAQQRRAVGRVATFQRWDNPIASSILDAINRIYGEAEDPNAPVDKVQTEQSKRMIFIVGSVAGGTGSGFLIDIANLVRHTVVSNSKFQSVDVSAVIVLPDAFSAYTNTMDDPTNLKPNSYAALRELDRFTRAHSANSPYMVRYGENLPSVTWSINQLLDHVYLVDTASPSAVGDFDLRGDPMRGVFPVIADFVMAHVDSSLGDGLATLRSNAGQHYDKEKGWQYSSFNVMTYILPVEDIIKSFSYRFLRDMLARQFLPISDRKKTAEVEQAATKEAQQVFSESSIGEKVNPGVVQKAIACTRVMNPEIPDVSWQGLFNTISLSESSFSNDYKGLENWFQYLRTNLIPTKEGDFKRESYPEGNIRLEGITNYFSDTCLGLRISPDNEEERAGGNWDEILDRYRDALRMRFAEALDVALLTVINRRDPHNKILEPARLIYARFIVSTLKQSLVAFKKVLAREYAHLNVETQLRQTSEQLRNAYTWMHETEETKTFAILGQPDARKAQDSYIGLFIRKMELTLHRKVYQVVVDILATLGADEKDKSGQLSILDTAALELESWQASFGEVDKILVDQIRVHENNRAQKQRVKVRRYLTNPKFEQELYQRPEHFSAVATRVLGQVRGNNGMVWARSESTTPLDFKMITVWTEEAEGPKEIADKFFIGMHELFQVVRDNVTVADRIQDEFTSSTSFVNIARQVNEPFLRYNPAENEKQMFHEFYTAFNIEKAQNDARRFMDEAGATLRPQGVQVIGASESKVACTILEVARGVQLRAVEQFIACEADYRTKLDKGRESLHLFTEEQVAVQYEGQIEALGEPANRLRPLSPDLVVTMGDNNIIRLFTLGCVYGLVYPDMDVDENALETREIFLKTKIGSDEPDRKLRLSESSKLRILDQKFGLMSQDEQRNRLYFNALQNFTLKAIEKREISATLVANLVDGLKNRGVTLGVENPFTYSVRDLGKSVLVAVQELGPDETILPDEVKQLNELDGAEKTKREAEIKQRSKARRDAENKIFRIARLETFLENEIRSFKNSPAQRIKDLGTVMHLVIREEIKALK